jgi:UDP-N-acetylmuramoyl-tripeptide--D-alanyl-D-alanine ligase
MMNLGQVAAWCGGTLEGEASIQVRRVHSDTRTLEPGDLFVALKGERFDANDYLQEAKTKGAVAALAHRGLQEAGLPGVLVADTRLALGQLAQAWRAQFNLPLIAVTGSNGKTTVTQMVASILRAAAGDAAFATQGNLNNDIGVPLTLLRMTSAHRLAVVELGMNHPGEIAYLANMAKPTVALVNNAQREHQEFMQTVEAVARENGAVVEALAANGVAVFPADDTYTPIWRELAGSCRSITFALEGTADCTATASWRGDAWTVQAQTPLGALAFDLHIAGRHNVKNALAAAACALAAGVALPAIAKGLSDFLPVKGRSRAMQICIQGKRITLIDDSYNANPDSVRAAIDVLAELPGPQLLILGDMGEVGNQGPEFHAEVGAYAREQGVSALFTLGDLAQHSAISFGQKRHFAGVDSMLDAIKIEALNFSSILIKGSRFMKMERAVQALEALQEAGNKEASCS